MIQVRDVFRTRYGKVYELVAHFVRFKDIAEHIGFVRPRISSDRVGPMFTVVTEYHVDSIDEYLTRMRGGFPQIEFRVWFNQMLALTEWGERNFYTVEAPPPNLEGEKGMIHVRNIYQARYGRGDDLVAHLKKEDVLSRAYAIPPLAIYTDLSGPMYTVIGTRDYTSFATYEVGLQKIQSVPEFAEWRRELLTNVETGRREIFQIE